ncbi:MAG: hypothetical protein ACJAR9_001977 [Celeribacter sp.]
MNGHPAVKLWNGRPEANPLGRVICLFESELRMHQMGEGFITAALRMHILCILAQQAHRKV